MPEAIRISAAERLIFTILSPVEMNGPFLNDGPKHIEICLVGGSFRIPLVIILSFVACAKWETGLYRGNEVVSTNSERKL
jgi:hypothetical protein